jgi:hypothetical protein
MEGEGRSKSERRSRDKEVEQEKDDRPKERSGLLVRTDECTGRGARETGNAESVGRRESESDESRVRLHARKEQEGQGWMLAGEGRTGKTSWLEMHRDERTVQGEVSGGVEKGEGKAGERSLRRNEPSARARPEEPNADLGRRLSLGDSGGQLLAVARLQKERKTVALQSPLSRRDQNAVRVVDTPGTLEERSRALEEINRFLGSGRNVDSLLKEEGTPVSSPSTGAAENGASLATRDRVARLAVRKRSAVRWPPQESTRGTGSLDAAEVRNMAGADAARKRHGSLVRWPPVHFEGSGFQSAARTEFLPDGALGNLGQIAAEPKVRRSSAPLKVVGNALDMMGESELVRGFKVVEPDCFLGPKSSTA